MRIGFVIYGPLDTVSGGYLYDRKLVEYLRAQGDTVEIISLPWRNYAAHLTDNLRFNLPPDLDILIQDELNHPSLIRANKGNHPYPIVSLVHHLRCSELRPKWQNDFYRVIERHYLQGVDGLVFNSKTTKNVVEELINYEKPSIIGYPPTDRFGEVISEREMETKAKRDKLHILFLGNVIQRKGLHILLEAIKGLTSQIKVDVVGGMTAEPKYASQMERYVSTHGLSSMVTFHGPLDNQPLIDMYKQSHVMVVPSSYEGFGIVYLEGMGFGLPAIGTTSGAAGEIITHGEDGYLIQPGDTGTLAKLLDELARDRDILLRLSLKAVKRYQSQPKWNETAKKIREFLHQTVEGRPPRASRLYMNNSMEYSFPHYLLSKQSVDDRALNKDVLKALKANLRQEPFRIIEVGAGIGSMLRRLIRWNVIHRAEYVIVDKTAENIEYASAWIPLWAEKAGLRVESSGENQLRVFDRDHDVQVHLEQADIYDFIQRNQAQADLLIAHAFLDLLPMPESLSKLLSLTNDLAWLTINFDGLTTIEPRIDIELDKQIERLYHETMNTRPTGGDSQSGRHLFGHLRNAGAEILAAGASDWVVFAKDGKYPEDEAYFLHFILRFFEESLSGHPELEAVAFTDWLRERHAQIERGELVYIAHQIDYLIRY